MISIDNQQMIRENISKAIIADLFEGKKVKNHLKLSLPDPENMNP